MEKKFDIALVLFCMSVLMLFSSTYMLYKTLDKSLNFINEIVQCTSMPQEQSFMIPQSGKSNI